MIVPAWKLSPNQRFTITSRPHIGVCVFSYYQRGRHRKRGLCYATAESVAAILSIPPRTRCELQE